LKYNDNDKRFKFFLQISGILLSSYTCPSLILSCDINSKGDAISLGLYNYNKLYVLKLFPNLDAVTKFQKVHENPSTTSIYSEISIYGDQNLVGKTCDINV
jgi:hypothetical protein